MPGFRGRLAAALVALLAAPPASAQYFRGKTLHLLIGPGTAGSGYDLHGRLVGRHLGRHLPGQPNVIVQNMNGGAGLVLANYLFNVAPRDGTAIGMVADAAPLNELLGVVGTRYRSAEFNWIGRITTVANLTMSWRGSPVATIADAMRVEIPVSAGPAGGNAYQMPALLNAIVGTKFRLVAGYPSTAAMQLAMERGETRGAYGDWASLKTTRPDWIRDRKINPLVQYTLERDRDLPDTPTAIELARTAQERQLLMLGTGGGGIGRHLVAPPGVAGEVVEMLRAGLAAALADPELLADAERSNLPVNPLGGAALQEIVAKVTATPPDVIARARWLLGGG